LSLRIGIDARHLSSKNNGIRTYLLNLLLSSIKKTKQTHKWFILSPYYFDSDFLNFENVKIIKMPISTRFVGFHILFTQIIIPVISLLNKLDVVWFPANRSSLCLPKSIAQVLTIHDLVWIKHPETMRNYGSKLDKFFMTKSANSADLVTTISNSSLRDILCNNLATSKNIILITSGVNTIAVGNSRIFKFDFFLFVGTLEPRKNLARVLHAYSKILPKISKNIKFVIVGNKGWGDVNLEKMISEYNLKKNVHVMKNIDDKMLAKLYSSAKFLVMPSLYEGFGLPLIEAMSYGTPVLTANNSSMPEVCGDAGLLVDAFDVNSIAEGLRSMILNKKLLKNLSNKARLNASRYSCDESSKKLLKVFEQAVMLRKSKYK